MFYVSLIFIDAQIHKANTFNKYTKDKEKGIKQTSKESLQITKESKRKEYMNNKAETMNKRAINTYNKGEKTNKNHLYPAYRDSLKM